MARGDVQIRHGRAKTAEGPRGMTMTLYSCEDTETYERRMMSMMQYAGLREVSVHELFDDGVDDNDDD